MTKALVLIANGSEEMEAVIIIDCLRRAKWEVTVAGVTGLTVTCSRGVKVVCDRRIEEVSADTFDILALPGGAEGTKALMASAAVLALARAFTGAGKWVAAVCAAPLVLQAAGLLKGRKVTCHPGVKAQLVDTPRLDDRVVVDGRLITSQGPGTSFEFALAIIRCVEGPAAADTVAKGLVL